MLTRIRNGIMSRKDKVEMPASNLKERVAELLRAVSLLLLFATGLITKARSRLCVGYRVLVRESTSAVMPFRRFVRASVCRFCRLLAVC